MSILITDKDLIQKMVKVESLEWLKEQTRSLGEPDRRDCTVYRATIEYAKHLQEYGSGEDFHYTIYGFGGWNRYFLREDGRVVFSRHHTSSNGIEKATEAGFDIE